MSATASFLNEEPEVTNPIGEFFRDFLGQYREIVIKKFPDSENKRVEDTKTKINNMVSTLKTRMNKRASAIYGVVKKDLYKYDSGPSVTDTYDDIEDKKNFGSYDSYDNLLEYCKVLNAKITTKFDFSQVIDKKDLNKLLNEEFGHDKISFVDSVIDTANFFFDKYFESLSKNNDSYFVKQIEELEKGNPLEELIAKYENEKRNPRNFKEFKAGVLPALKETLEMLKKIIFDELDKHLRDLNDRAIRDFINDSPQLKGGATDTGEAPNASTTDPQVSIEEIEKKIIITGLDGGIKVRQNLGNTIDAFDVRKDLAINEKILNGNSFTGKTSYQGKEYIIVALALDKEHPAVKKVYPDGATTWGKDGFIFATIENKDDLPSNIEEILKNKAISSLKAFFKDIPNISQDMVKDL